MTELLKNKVTKEQQNINTNKKTKPNTLYMAGGGFSGLTSQTLRPLSVGLTRFLPEIPPDHIQFSVRLNGKKRNTKLKLCR